LFIGDLLYAASFLRLERVRLEPHRICPTNQPALAAGETPRRHDTLYRRPRGLKPCFIATFSGAAQAAPFQNLFNPLGPGAATWFLLGPEFRALKILEQGVQALEVALPEAPVSLHPDLKLLKRRWTQRINSALSVYADVHQASGAEHPQMFGDLRLAQMQAIDHFPDRPWSVTQQFDDLKTVGLAQRFQGFDHDEC